MIRRLLPDATLGSTPPANKSSTPEIFSTCGRNVPQFRGQFEIKVDRRIARFAKRDR